jgi:hypothetical protein
MAKRSLPTAQVDSDGVVTMADPEPFIKGKFSIYETPDHGFHVAALFDGETEVRHAEIPGAMLKMAGMLSGSNPMTTLKNLFGGG